MVSTVNAVMWHAVYIFNLSHGSHVISVHFVYLSWLSSNMDAVECVFIQPIQESSLMFDYSDWSKGKCSKMAQLSLYDYIVYLQGASWHSLKWICVYFYKRETGKFELQIANSSRHRSLCQPHSGLSALSKKVTDMIFQRDNNNSFHAFQAIYLYH